MKKINNHKHSSLSILVMAGVQPYQEQKNEKYMNTQQVHHFKKILIAWKNQLNDENSHSNTCMKEKSGNFPDPIDRAVQEEEFSIELRNRTRTMQLVKQIQHTLKKLENNDFGYCETCNIEIGIRRLEARPTASLCIDCKTLEEIRHKQMSG